MTIRSLILLLLGLTISCSHVAATDNEGGLQFIANKGQWNNAVQYKAQVPGGAVFFTGNSFRYCFYDMEAIEQAHDSDDPNGLVNCHAYDVKFVNSKTANVNGEEKQETYHNYFIGKDKNNWQSNVPLFSQVTYHQLYDNINMKVYSRGVALKYDLLVAPGGNINDIKIAFDGVQPSINEKGELVITTTVNEVVELAPYAYQVINGVETEVACDYRLENGVLAFSCPGGFDKNHTLVIDPALVYATYTGSTGQLWGYCSAYDASGNFYSATQAWTAGYPITAGAFQVNYNGFDIAINKYTYTGGSLVYSTYLGGQLKEWPCNMRVNRRNELVVVGVTLSADFPLGLRAFDSSLNGDEDLFVTVFDPVGFALVGSSYIGGDNTDGRSGYFIQKEDEFKMGLALDKQNNIYVATSTTSPDFPTTNSAYDKSYSAAKDGIVFKMSDSCQDLLFSTYLGGGHNDYLYDCRLNYNNDVVVAGMTFSNDYPLSSGAYSDTGKAFVSTLDNSGTTLKYSTKIGVYSGSAIRLSIGDSNDVFVCGNCDTGYVPSTGTYAQAGGRVFIARLTEEMDSMIMTTRLIPVPTPGITGFVNVCGDVVASVYLNQANTSLPVSNNAHRTSPATYYFFHMPPALDKFTYATYFGINSGNAHSHGHANVIDSTGVIWSSSCISTNKNMLTGTAGSYAPTSKSVSTNSDFYSAKFDMEVLAAKPVAAPVMPDTTCSGIYTYFDNLSLNAYSYIWNFGDGDTSHADKPAHIYNNPGVYVVTLEAMNPYSCKLADMVTDTIVVDSVRITSKMVIKDTVCRYEEANFVNTSVKGLTYLWDFGDGTTDTTTNTTHTYNTAGTFTVKLMAYNPNICNLVDTAVKTIYVDGTSPAASFTPDVTTACVGKPIIFLNTSQNANSYEWDYDEGGPVDYTPNPSHEFSQWGFRNVSLIAVNNNLCVPKDTVKNTVYILRPSEFDLFDSSICADDTVTLQLQLKYLNSFVEYSWEPANAIYGSADKPQVVVDPKKSKRFVVTVTDSIIGKCSNLIKDTVNLFLVDYPTDVFIEANDPLCVGDTLRLNSGTSMNVPRLLYTWHGPAGFSGHESKVIRGSVEERHSGIYGITIDNQGCAVTKYTDVEVKPQTEVTAGNNSPLSVGDELKLNAETNIGVDSIAWEGPNMFTSDRKNPRIPDAGIEAAGTYTVFVSARGCVASDITQVQIDEPDSQYVKLYPNPNNGKFYIQGKGLLEQVVEVRVVNSIGQSIYFDHIETDDKKAFKQHITLSSAASGVYVMWILMDAEYWCIPFTILRE